jgi:hypothetical protein
VLSSLQGKPPPASPYASLNTVLDYAPAHPAHSRLLCAVLHPREPSCTRNFLGFFKKEWLTSAKFVAAWMAALQLLSWRKVVKDPETALFSGSSRVETTGIADEVAPQSSAWRWCRARRSSLAASAQRGVSGVVCRHVTPQLTSRSAALICVFQHWLVSRHGRPRCLIA